ncbi:fatty acid desaturase family protein [Streptomyces sp. SLBN-8D4]|jgi:fatty acid desaturase|uniref:fatty acid desaturase family protein n=1 Tax=Streptomyces sp. SLBN-8D4 TaxID=3377728 RepID=UPI003C7D77F4
MNTDSISPAPSAADARTGATARPAEEKPYRKGYRLPPGLRDEIAAAHRTRPALTVACALTDVVTALAAAVVCAWLLTALNPLVSIPAAIAGCLFIARQLRALENLTHEASHYNWSRHHRRWNDVLGWLLSGLPTGGRLSAYRESHLRHHGRFGTSEDPDRRRYAELDLEALRRTSVWAFASSVAVRITRYQIGWLREVKTDLFATAGVLLWSVVCATLPSALLVGPGTGVLSGVLWLVSAFVVLPVLRLIAESDEHIYSDCDTVFDATITNVGFVQRVLIHPHADGYHTVHHLWPGIPHHSLRRVHTTLMTQDPDYGRRIRMRQRLLETPRAVSSSS